MYESHLLLSKLNQLLERNLGLPTPPPDADLFDCGALDSLEFAGLLLQVEDEFGVSFTFEDMDLDHFRSVSGIARSIADRLP
ncbi:MAG TPA: acyl carrier protein [Gammaproteobacteria bacterium]|jgi:acyl carrier protein|nr:acyl carrier protein [Gammaproteobacteria bacterium]